MGESRNAVGSLEDLLADFRVADMSSDAVFAALRGAILTRTLMPGQRLTEDDLARAFGVSRTPVREAILRLQGERLVDRLGRRGLAVTQISPAEVVEIYDVRRVLDGLACELAALRAAPPDIAQLRWVNDRMRAAGEKEEYRELAALNFEFHEWMARASNNSFLLQKVREVQDRVRRFDKSTLDYPGRWRIAIEEHEAIISALESRNSEQSRNAAELHMLNSRAVRLIMVREVGTDSGSNAFSDARPNDAES